MALNVSDSHEGSCRPQVRVRYHQYRLFMQHLEFAFVIQRTEIGLLCRAITYAHPPMTSIDGQLGDPTRLQQPLALQLYWNRPVKAP